MYGKIFASMYDGSLYGNWKAIVTFQQMIVLCDQAGVVDMTPQALAARTSIPLEIIREGIELLEAPDQYSRTRDHEGRRIERIDADRPWGWQIINYKKYRDMVSAEQKREADRVRMAIKRAAEKKAATKSDEPEPPATESDETRRMRQSQIVANVAHTEVEVEVKGVGRASRLTHAELPDDWREFCEAKRPDLDPEATFDRFRDYWLAVPGAKGRKLDWTATWRNWCRDQRAPPPRPHAADNGDSPSYREYLASLKGQNVI